MTNFEPQRLAMVESQLRPNEVTAPRLLAAMRALPRERFVPRRLSTLAYMDESIEVFPAIDGAPARFLLAPMVLARLVQLAAVEPDDSVLDVGCATGYSTIVLGRLAQRVVALESDPALAREVAARVRELGTANCVVTEGPLADGAPGEAPFDAILLEGAVPAVAPALIGQLAEGGRLVAMVHEGPLCRAYAWQRSGKTVDRQPAFEGAADPLPGFEAPAEFVL
jgi:protein-L-isoaspartate(D-aspartate) O-methyltransferase